MLSNWQFTDLVLARLQVCVACGTDSPGALLCALCSQNLRRDESTQWVLGYSHATLSLFHWTERNAKLSRLVIMSLKGKSPKRLFTAYAEELVQKRFQFANRAYSLKKEFLLIPSPPIIQGVPDHAGCLTLELAAALGAESRPLLKRNLERKQKVLGQVRRWEHLLNRFTSVGALSEIERNEKRIVFVDDLITTGATARAAYLALKCPKFFEVWTLFHRLACGHAAHLL